MSVYLISDTHFGHKNIISYCNRPFSSVEEMDKTLIKNWNSVVKKEDTVYHLGDFAFGNKEFTQKIVKQLNGYIRLVLGNHDMHSIQFYYDCGFHRVYDRPIIINKYFILTHRPIEPIDEKGIYANFYGHVHDNPRFREATARSFNVSSDNIGFTPILFEDAVAKMEEKENGTY